MNRSYFLLSKTHTTTNLKYLCRHFGTEQTCKYYQGSGDRWKKHLRKHGSQHITRILFNSQDLTVFKQVCLFWSVVWDVVKNPEWANLVYETGENGGAVGRKYSAFLRTKLSKAHLGRKASLETRRNMSRAHLGVQRSSEARRNISNGLKKRFIENKHPTFGTKLSLEHKQKISKANKGHFVSAKTRMKISTANTDPCFATRVKLSLAATNRWKKRKEALTLTQTASSAA